MLASEIARDKMTDCSCNIKAKYSRFTIRDSDHNNTYQDKSEILLAPLAQVIHNLTMGDYNFQYIPRKISTRQKRFEKRMEFAKACLFMLINPQTMDPYFAGNYRKFGTGEGNTRFIRSW